MAVAGTLGGNPWTSFYWPGDNKRPYKTRYIDVILDALNETTPVFTLADIYGREAGSQIGYNQGRIPAQVVRTTNTASNVNLVLEACLMLEDGTLLQQHNGTALEDAWDQTPPTGNYVALTSTEHGELVPNTNPTNLFGMALRLRYASSGTDPVRIVIPTRYRTA